MLTEAQLKEILDSPEKRLSSGLYKIVTKSDDDDGEGLVVPFRMNAAQEKLFTNLHNRNVVPKARQLGICLHPDTRVLTADLRWVRIADLKIGEKVVAVDEHSPGGRGKARKMRTATVNWKQEVHRKSYRITLDDGRELICTDQHPWLCRKAATDCKWMSISGKGNQVTGKLKVGTRIRWVTKPWGEGSFEDGWMGEMLDGEGSMALPSRAGASVSVSQLDGPVFDRMWEYFLSEGYSYRFEIDGAERRSKFGSRQVNKICVTRMDEIFKLIGKTRPTRFLERFFWEGKELPGSRTGIGWSSVVSIEEIGYQTMIDMETSEKTFIAEGFVSHNTTGTCMVWLDTALFSKQPMNLAIVAHEKTAAEDIFGKITFAYDNLPAELRELMPLEKRTATKIVFAHNGCSIKVSTSVRSGTFHRLHVSELGQMDDKYPLKAKEVITGSIPTVPLDGVLIIESTADCKSGNFHDIVMRAKGLQEKQSELSPLDYKIHFFPWYEERDYKMSPRGVIITDADHDYFDKIEANQGVIIDTMQRAWYCAKRDSDFSGDEEMMKTQYPSTVEEPFETSKEGCYFTKQLTTARKQGRICRLPILESVPCWTWWDIGNSDGTAMWVMQKIGMEYRLIDFYEAWGEPYSHAAAFIQDSGLIFDRHFLPHDADHVRQGQYNNRSPREMLEEVLPGHKFEVVDRIQDINWGIQQTRDVFPMLYFDEVRCKNGIAHLDEYKKRRNRQQGTWSDQPEKTDGHSEAADALRQFGQAYKNGMMNISSTSKIKRPRSWRGI